MIGSQFSQLRNLGFAAFLNVAAAWVEQTARRWIARVSNIALHDDTLFFDARVRSWNRRHQRFSVRVQRVIVQLE